MAHVAELDADNRVIRVIVVHNDYEPNIEAWATQWAGGGVWKQTSYNAAANGFRKNFAGIGFTYDKDKDAFIPLKCHNEATLDNATCRWVCVNAVHTI